MGDAVVEIFADEPFLTLSEGLIKVRCMEAALSLGWVLQEGAGSTPSGPVADYVRSIDGSIAWERAKRRVGVASGSADLAVVEPFEMLLEIKARPDYGTKSQAQFKEMVADVRRVAHHTNMAFLFVLDPRIYRSFSGEKVEQRGRPAIDHEWFVNSFPKWCDFANAARPIQIVTEFDEHQIELIARGIPFMGNELRGLIMGARLDASF